MRQLFEWKGVNFNDNKSSVGKEHIHILVSCLTSLGVSKLVQQIKEKTSRVFLNNIKI